MIQIKDLSFGYSNDELILNNLNMSVPKGSIYGFVGANGAGKSTTIRLLLRLLSAKKGKILIDDKELKGANFEKIGFLVDNPVFYDHLTCFQNIKLLQHYYPNIKNKRITEVMELLGLSTIKDYLYKNCSTGMKQRMGIAKAIIHQPDLIILDEPLNGLDPEWVIYIRDILIEINQKHHSTIFFTNHILSEVEKIASYIGILKAGQLVVEMPIEDVAKMNYQKSLFLTCDFVDKISFDLLGIPYTRLDDGKLVFKISEDYSINAILASVIENGIVIKNVEIKGNDLETIFLNTIS